MSSYDDDLLDEEDEEMAAERDLASDAQWKIIQKNTFTRWANEHLKTVNKNISDLEADLADGLRLVALVEVLSGKKFKFVNRRPNFRTQKLENVTMALEFLERDEGIRIVNIDSGDIVDSKLKLILGLIWTLILHYSISMPMWEGEEPQPQEGGPTPKQRLLNWIGAKVPDLPVKNFTTDWNDGKAIGALVDAIAPGLCPDWEDWDPKKAKKNAKEAMDAAEEWLDVPQLIKPEEMTNPKVDDLSMMTYLSQFPKAKLKPGAPLRPKQNAGKVRAYGPGIEPKGNTVGNPAKFTVETFSAGAGNLDVNVIDPKGKPVKCDSVFNNDRNKTYSCTYVPAMEGEFRVIVKFAEKEIHKSPFKVGVEAPFGDPTKVTAAGPGLEKTGVSINKKTHFEIFTKDAGRGTVAVTITDPAGKTDTVKPTIHPINKDGVYLVEYTATIVGLHKVTITFNTVPIPHSPWEVNVSPAINPKAVYATGRGIQPRGVRIKQNAEFKVHTKDAGVAEVKVQIIGPGGVNIPCTVKPSTTEEGVYDCVYVPPKVGQYVINITFGGQHITRSPFRVDVGPEKFSRIVAYGPGLESGVVNQPACFTVETNGETGALGFSIEGPSQAKIDCKDNGDGSADVTYWPTLPGEYAIHILCDDEDIPQAPYMAQIQPSTTAFDASKVIAKGPGLEPTGVLVNKVAEFTVDAKKAGKAPLKITCIDENYKPVEVKVTDNKDGTYSCKYTPKSPVKHTIIITWGTIGIPKSPFRVYVSEPVNPGNVKVYGPGVEKGVKTFVLTHFTVDCKTAGPGDVAIALVDDKGKDVPVNTIDNQDGTFTVEYEPKTPGVYTISVYFADKQIPKSPIKVKVESSIDLSKVTVKGLETPIPLGHVRTVTIVTMGLPKKDAPCKVTVTSPKNKTVELPVKKSPEGYTTDFKPTEEGPHKVDVTYDNKPAPDSPFTVQVVPPPKKMALIEVKGLEKPIQVGETRPVTVVTKSAPKKDAPCTVKCITPKGNTLELPLKKVPEGFSTSLTPTEAGPHKVEVTYDNNPIQQSPITVEVIPKGGKPKGAPAAEGPVEITVKGLDTPIQTGEKRPISIIISKIKKDAVCKITITNPKGRTSDLKPKSVSDGFEAIFTPWDTGVHKIKIEYDSKPAPGSPFSVEVFKVNVSAVIVKGLEKPIPLGETRMISIITKDAGKPDLPCTVTVTTPKGTTKELPTEKSPDGYTSPFTPEEPGEHKVAVKYASKEVPKSPFKVAVEEPKVKPEEVIKPAEQAPTQAAAPKASEKPAPTKPTGDVTVKGLEAPVNPGEKRPVIIDTTKAPKKDAPCKVSMTNPKGRTVELKTKPAPDGYETAFSSWDKGMHQVKVEYDGKEIPDSPFSVLVEKIDVSQVTVQGLDKPIQLGETRTVTIDTSKTGRPDAPCKVTVITPKEKTVELQPTQKPDGYECLFTPEEKGVFTVKIQFAGKEVPKSPFSVTVHSIDVSGVKVQGLKKPIMVGEKRKITIDTTATGKTDLPCKVLVKNPKGQPTELFTSKIPEGHETFFTPTDLGPHKVEIKVAGEEVPGSVFSVEVIKFELRIEVEGLDTPIMAGEKRLIKVLAEAPAKPNKFAPPPSCKVTVTNPKGRTQEPKVDKTSTGFETVYSSNEPGPHIFKIEHNGKEVPDSPFTVEVEKLEVRKVEVKGLDKPIEVGEVRPIEIDTTKAGKIDAPCRVQAIGPKGDTADLPTQKAPTGYETSYAPLEVGPHKVKVEYGGKELPKSPFPVEVTPKDKAAPKEAPKEAPKAPTVSVKGLETPVTVGEKRPVTVTTDKPQAPCKITATNPKGKTSDVPTKKTPQGYEATFAPLEDGPHKVKVEHDGKEVPGSPFPVEVQPKVDLSKVQVKGLETPVKTGEQRPVNIITKPTGKPDAPCKVTATNPKGKQSDLPTKKTPEGYDTIFAPLESGPHQVKVEVDGKEVPKSPFKVNVEPSVDVSKVTVSGLEKPIPLGETRPITINTSSTGKPDAPCKVTAKGPTTPFVEIPTIKIADGYKCSFTPKEVGQNVVKVEFAEKEVPKSPFQVKVEPKVEKIDATKVTVKGLESPIEVGEPRPISINTLSTGKPDAPCKVLVSNPKGQVGELPVQKAPEGYATTFAPLEPGPHKVNVNFAGQEVPKSPFPVNVEPKANVGAVTVKGLETPIEVGEPRPITINTLSTGKPDAPCKVLVSNPVGQVGELPVQKAPEGYATTFAPLEPGPHKVNVNFAGQEVPKSPFPVNVEPKANVGAVTVKGLETPIEVGEPRPIAINTTSTGKPDAPCKVMVTNPVGQVGELPVQKAPEGYATTFAPLEPGPHKVNVNFAGQEVPKSPFAVNVEPKANVAAVTVKGLETPIEVGEPRPISINTLSTGKPDAPCKVLITNPKGQVGELPVQKAPEGYATTFAPLEPGPHKVNVNFAGQEVPKSPFAVNVEPKANVGAVTVKGLETPIEVDEARPVQVNTVASGKPDAPCHMSVVNPKGQAAELPLQKTPEGYQTVFAPLEPGPHVVRVDFAGQEVPKSPFNVNVEPKVDLGAVEVLGLETPVKVGEPRPITVMTSTTGKPDAPCRVLVTKPTGQTQELPTRKIPEGYTTTLAPTEVGPHKVNVDFNGKEVPKSPFSVMAEPAIDFSKVKVSGLDEPVEVGEIRPVKVDTAECGVVDAPCQLTATNPAGQVRELPVQKTPTGYQGSFAPLEEGPHQVAVKYAGKELPKSPFPVKAVPQGPPCSKVKAYGPGLETGTATKPCQFTIDTREVTQPGGLGVTVEGPAESKIECRDNQNGTCDVTYYPSVPGDYNINITYADEHIPKSPFKANIKPSGVVDVSGVKAYGPGLEPDVFLDSPTGFTVDAKSVTPSGEGKVRAIVTSPSGHKTESLVKNNNDGTYDVLYTPTEKGPNTLDITYEDHPIPKSPVKVEAAPGCDPSKVKAYGPGLESGVTDAKQVFTVDVKGAGQGGLALAIDGPAETEIKCKDNRDGTCEVEYIPVKKGDYDITIKFADQHVPGSPFHVPVKDTVNPSKVKCYGPGLDSNLVKSNAPATFTVDTSEAGEAPLEVTYTDSTGVPQQADIVPVEAGKYEAKYFPKDDGKCTVDVKYANQNVPNSPFNINVQPGVNPNKVHVSGDGVKPTVLASMPVQFVIDTREAGIADLDVVIRRPDGTFIRPTVTNNNDGTYTVQYTPEDCGLYQINITFGNQVVPKCPIETTAVPTGDASKCKITDGLQQTIPVEKETVISVDASEAGTGKVTCRIRSPTGAEIDIDIVENLDGTFSILFTPTFPGDYSINIKFGGQSIPEGDYIIQVGEDLIAPETVDTVQAAKGEGLFQPQEFVIPVGPIFNFVTAYITMPSGKKAYPKIVDNKDGTVTVRYQPQETGLHELHLCYNQQEIEGSPFQFHVDAINSGFVTAYGPGLSHGVVNVPAEFTIVTKDAGAGGLSLAIEGPSKTEIKCKDNGDGTCTVTYVPTAPGEYNITVKFADKNISGSPFVAKVTAGEPKQKAQIGRSSELSLKVTETDITNLTASIRSPSGQEEPCMLKRLPNGHLGISFTPHETGEHLVNVFRDGQHIANSPFKIVVGESELGNASKVKVYGKGLEEGMANEVNEFIVDTREAGYGGLSLSIEGPSKADIECHDNEDGTCRVTYKPTEPGTYIINIKFADEHVTSSPFKVKIGGEPSERITERIMRHREAADVTHVGSECELSLKIPASFLMRMTGQPVTQAPAPGTSPFDMTASVTSPHGVTELCDVVNLDDCHYSIKFVPKEMGIHTVSVKHKDMHIPGSPFQFTVGPIAGGGAHKVHAAGLGLVRGEVEQPNEFNIYTREAGAGGLSIAVEGPSKAEVDFEDRKDGSCGVTYSVTEPGEYLVSIKFNDEHIPDSPFRVPITPSIGDARKLSVRAMQNKGLAIGKPCAFVVNFNGAAKGKLQARVVSPSGAEVEALVQEIDDGEYAVRFIPRENGPHLVYVSFDGCQIPDSPFRILVGSVQADPGMVQAHGEGLKTGKTGQVSKFIVNTVNAGSGALAVTVEGPSKVKLECTEVEDGYEFTYTPTAPGDYLITIKYSGTNIAGSPYKARVEGQGKPSGYQEQSSVVVETVTKTSVMSKFASLPPFQSDASKVTCDGNGLKKGYRNKQCTFNVDTSQAGTNMLFIGMIGPKGPCEELCVKHNPGMPYKITYLVKERGDYMLAVKWGEEHIPGSPFYVRVD